MAPDQTPTSDDLGARYTSLAEVLRALRRQRLLILAITLACVAIAVALSAVQEKEYEAEAAVAFVDQSQDLGILGNVAVRSIEPDQLAASQAERITRPELLQGLRRRLDVTTSVETLEDRLESGVEPTSNLVLVTATAPQAREAARLANGLADEAVTVARREARDRYNTAARRIRRRLDDSPSAENRSGRVALEDQLVRLESLAVLARPATVARAAEVPDSPSSPKPVRNGVVGGIFGLMVALVAAFARSSLDRRLRDPRDIGEELEIPVLGNVSAATLGHVAHVGAKVGDDHREMEAFRILSANISLLEDERPLTVLAVTSALPDEGKTTVASSLACASGAIGRRTLLVECDLRRPTLAGRLGIEAAPGLSDYLMGTAQPEEILQTVAVVDRSVNGSAPPPAAEADVSHRRIVCVTAGSPVAHPTELLATNRFSEFLEEVRSVYDIVVIDTCPLLPVADTLQLLPQVDGVIFCVRSAQTTRDQARGGKAIIDRLDDLPTGLVVTGLKKRDETEYGYYGGYGYGGYETVR